MARKKSTKKPKTLETPNDQDLGGSSDVVHDPIVERIFAKSQERFGDRVFINGEEAARVFAIDVPLALKILFQFGGFPLGRIVMLVGEHSSCKSALAYEFARLHRLVQGGFSLIETEDKESASLRASIVGYDPTRSAVVYCDKIEDWMAALTEQIEEARAGLDEEKPPRARPWCFLVDSIAGVTTQGIAEKIEKEGFASLVQPHAANIIATYCKCLPHMLDPYPLSVVLVNHLKRGVDRYGNRSIRNLQGGAAPKFHESIELELRAGPQQERRAARQETFREVKISVMKNSLAQSGPELEVEFVWCYVDDPVLGPMTQRSMFDWNTTLMNYLIDGDISKGDRQKINDILRLKVKTVNKSPRVYSSVLGIPENAPVTYRQAGALIESRRDLVEKLYEPLQIRKTWLFKPGSSIDTQRAEAKRALIRVPGDGLTVDPIEFFGGTVQASESATFEESAGIILGDATDESTQDGQDMSFEEWGKEH